MHTTASEQVSMWFQPHLADLFIQDMVLLQGGRGGGSLVFTVGGYAFDNRSHAVAAVLNEDVYISAAICACLS